MAGPPLQKRACDLFISYAHADRALVDPIVGWLRRSAGLEVWYDASDGSAAEESTELLTRGIQSARGALFFLSPRWKASRWCKSEHEVANNERHADDDFVVLAVSIDEVELPDWFQIRNVLNAHPFGSEAAAGLLRSLSAHPPARFDNDADVYFSGPWSRPSDAAASLLRALQKGFGWRLVGDSKDHPHLVDARERIRGVIETCRGLVAIAPLRADKPNKTSPYVLEEIRIARELKKPYLVFAESGVELPDDIVVSAHGGVAEPMPSSEQDPGLRSVLERFEEEMSARPHSDRRAYAFVASSLLDDPNHSDDLLSVVKHATCLDCVLGRQLEGEHVQRAIIERIRNAAFVIADVSDGNRNSLIEAGVARGAGTPLHVIAKATSDRKTRFMFSDLEMGWYETPIERLGIVHRIARKYRRRVLAP